MDTGNKTYPALNIPASELSAFAVCIDLFIISLKNGNLVHFTPDDGKSFYDWLVAHGIRDVEKDKGFPTELELEPNKKQKKRKL